MDKQIYTKNKYLRCKKRKKLETIHNNKCKQIKKIRTSNSNRYVLITNDKIAKPEQQLLQPCSSLLLKVPSLE